MVYRAAGGWIPAGIGAGRGNPAPEDPGLSALLFAPNGIELRRSADGEAWVTETTPFLGQKDWPWAAGRLTAGFLLDLRAQPAVGPVLMGFHGSEFPETDPRGGFDTFASPSLAWSPDLTQWHCPGP